MKRRTQQGRAIRKAFEEAQGPMTPSQILQRGRRHVPTLGIATVYRSVKEFTRKGWLRIVDIPGSTSTRFELSRLGHHHHFHCRLCDQVFDIPDCSADFDSSPDQYDVLDHDVVFFGRCAGCSLAT